MEGQKESTSPSLVLGASDEKKAERRIGVTGHCYCGELKYRITIDDPEDQILTALMCHCDSCRRAHAAPMYHVVYVKPTCFTIEQGETFLKSCQKTKESPIRCFCSNCGSRICNKIEHPALKRVVGFFPHTLEKEVQQAMPQHFLPSIHVFCEEDPLRIPNHLQDGVKKVPTVCPELLSKWLASDDPEILAQLKAKYAPPQQ